MRLYSHFDTFELYNIRRGVGKLFFCFFASLFFVPPYFGGGAGSFPRGDAPGGEPHRPQQQFSRKGFGSGEQRPQRCLHRHGGAERRQRHIAPQLPG